MRFAFIFIIFINGISVLAQPGGGGDPGHGAPVPIGGIEILLIAGTILGIKILFSSRKKETH